MIKNILVPTDFSKCSVDAVKVTVQLAKRLNAIIHLLHVVETPVVAYDAGMVDFESLPQALFMKEMAEENMKNLLKESFMKGVSVESKIEYDDSLDLAELYKMSAKILNMAPEAHQEQIFKQILNGVKSVVVGLGSLRNKLGDAHGKSSKSYKPKERHIELAVNLSGSVALFLYKTFKAQILLKANLNE